MAGQFSHGYALLIAVDDNAVADYALPAVAKDVAALAEVLQAAERCAYPPDHVKVVQGQAATRSGILEGLDWLAERIAQDPGGDATAVIYYTGHGVRERVAGALAYYLIPYDMRPGPIGLRALRAEDFAAGISALRPRRLLVLLDCCHAAGMGVKGAGAALPAAMPVAPFMAGAPDAAAQDAAAPGPAAAGAKGPESLALGAGRAVLSSSRDEQPSYLRRDGAMSIFTYHLIEALTGHAQPAEGASEVLVSDVMSHVWRRVPASARADWGREQQPDYQVSGNFPVALLLGGRGLPKGQPAPDPLAPPAGAGVRQVHIGTGDYVEGSKIEGDWVGGDKIGGNKFGGDQYNFGDISGSTGMAIGRHASVRITSGVSGPELERIFQSLDQAARNAPAGQRDAAVQTVQALKAEAAKGPQADDGRMAKLIDNLVALVPGAVSAVVSAFGTPLLGGLAGPVTRFVLDKLAGR